jgi:hypothetical protein
LSTQCAAPIWGLERALDEIFSGTFQMDGNAVNCIPFDAKASALGFQKRLQAYYASMENAGE